MFWAAIGCMLAGAALAVVGWVLNSATPIQQPLPAVGVVVFLVGFVMLMIKMAVA